MRVVHEELVATGSRQRRGQKLDLSSKKNGYSWRILFLVPLFTSVTPATILSQTKVGQELLDCHNIFNNIHGFYDIHRSSMNSKSCCIVYFYCWLWLDSISFWHCNVDMHNSWITRHAQHVVSTQANYFSFMACFLYVILQHTSWTVRLKHIITNNAFIRDSATTDLMFIVF